MPLHCQHCGEPVPIDEPIPRDSSCENCGNDLRACANCRHYDTSRNNQCTETEADPVTDKARRNFCEFFYFSREKHTPRRETPNREDEARRRLNALFGGGGGAPPPGPARGVDREAEARRKLDALFGKKPKQDG